MPQFDSFSFPGQVYWSLGGFSFLYFFGLQFILNQFSLLFKMRQKLASLYIKDDKNGLTAVNIFNFFSIKRL